MYVFGVLFLLVGSVLSHQYYQDLIPNGRSVPNPCGGGTWQAVGHYDPLHHTQSKNPFGMDFAAAGYQWNKALCGKDSDGDGRSNGEELGDPNCTWTSGAPAPQTATGHPGICNPVGSCSGQAFRCGCHGPSCVGK